MQHITKQLEKIRNTSRNLLVMQRLMQWSSVLLVVAIMLCFLDYWLRLPSIMRVLIDIIMITVGGYWISIRLKYALNYKPRLSTLALKAEKLFPSLQGILATGVDFSVAQNQYSQSDITDDLIRNTIGVAEEKLQNVNLKDLYDLRYTYRCGAYVFVVILFLIGSVYLSSPHNAKIALQRWSMPFGGIQWPNRVSLENTSKTKQTTIDQRIGFSAEVSKGYKPQMRVVMRYQVLDKNKNPISEKLSINLSESKSEDSKSFETQVGFYDYFSAEQNDGKDQSGYVRYSFKSGDGETLEAELSLVLRPGVIACDVVITPPAYAALLGQTKLEINLNSGELSTIKAIEGSKVELRWTLNKKVVVDASNLKTFLPGIDMGHKGNQPKITYKNDIIGLSMIASETMDSQVKLLDDLGFANQSQRVYRIEVIKDKLPTVKITKPNKTVDVSPLAVVPLEAVSQDDVAIHLLTLKSETHKPIVKDSKAGVETKVYEIKDVAGQSPILAIDTELDLAQYNLKHGDSVKIFATAQDGFKIGDQRHTAVNSKTITLNIIDAAKIIEKIMKDLGHVRKNVESITVDQKQLLDNKKIDEVIKKQKQISRRIDNQSKQVEAIERQAAMNKISDENINTLISQIKKNLAEANKKSKEAEKKAESKKNDEVKDKNKKNQDDKKIDNKKDDKKEEQKDNKKQDNKKSKDSKKSDKKSDSKSKPSDEKNKDEEKEDQKQEDKDQNKDNQEENEVKKKQEEVIKPLEDILKMLDHNNAILQIKVRLNELKKKQNETILEGVKIYPKTIGRSFALLSDANKESVESLGQNQTQHFNQSNTIIQLIQNTVTGLENQSSKAKDRASAEMLTRVIRIALEDGLLQSTYTASLKILKNNISEAGSDQKEAIIVIQKMLKELNDHDKLKKEILKLTLRELNEDIQKLIKSQKKEILKLEKEDKFFNNLIQPMRRLYKKSFATRAKANEIDDTKPIAELISKAMTQMNQSVSALKEKNKTNASNAETKSLEFLEKALAENKKLQEKADGDEEDEKREQTRRKYLALAKRELDLKMESVKIIGNGEKLSRLQMRKLNQISTKQNELTKAIGELKKELENSTIFLSVHDEIDELSLAIIDRLSKKVLDIEVVENQQDIVDLLLMVAEALEKVKPTDEMSEGGGGGSGSGKPPLIGPVKEIKLLRAKQLRVLRKTKTLDNNTQDVNSNNYKRKVKKLGKMQDQVVEQAVEVSKKIPKQ